MTKVGNNINSKKGNWTFAKKKVVNNFDHHILKSVPLYKEGHQLILDLSEFFLKENAICYDIGCSTGELVKKIDNRLNIKTNKYYGIDTEKNMLQFAKRKNKSKNISFINSDILKVKLKKSDLIISYYTMQFIKPKQRVEILKKIYKSLNWGGGFIMFEKVRAPDARFQDLMLKMYDEFKISNGFGLEEIASKTRSLYGILEPFSTNGNKQILKAAGFKDIMTISKYICFEGFLAIK
tara:strand:- start:814 stop:1524 length:711 start_codon:yes stop_codon:yes gene_type:complete